MEHIGYLYEMDSKRCYRNVVVPRSSMLITLKLISAPVVAITCSRPNRLPLIRMRSTVNVLISRPLMPACLERLIPTTLSPWLTFWTIAPATPLHSGNEGRLTCRSKFLIRLMHDAVSLVFACPFLTPAQVCMASCWALFNAVTVARFHFELVLAS